MSLLDKHPDRSAVIATSLDWSAAFDRQDPTIVIAKFIKLEVRSSLIPLLSSYLTDRQMKVKFNGEMSDFLSLVGGNPQGTLLGQLGFIAQSDDNATTVPLEDRYKYIDDLSLLHLVLFADLLSKYDTKNHVPSDIGIDDAYLPTESFKTQQDLDRISEWTLENLSLLNEKKCNYMVFSRSQTNISTRLTVNQKTLERVSSTDMLGMKISSDLSWDRHCQSICQKAYSRIGMLTKLKYAGVGVEDLVDIYMLMIRSITEYCSVVFHSSLTLKQRQKLEMIQKICLRVILGDMYVSYEAALEMTG